jgi:PadR family transcriptional regulator PadR
MVLSFIDRSAGYGQANGSCSRHVGFDLQNSCARPMHGWAIAQRLCQVSKEVLQVQQGALLSRATSPRATGLDSREVGRIGEPSARQVLSLTAAGAKYLRQEQAQWKRLSLAIELVFDTP